MWGVRGGRGVKKARDIRGFLVIRCEKAAVVDKVD